MMDILVDPFSISNYPPAFHHQFVITKLLVITEIYKLLLVITSDYLIDVVSGDLLISIVTNDHRHPVILSNFHSVETKVAAHHPCHYSCLTKTSTDWTHYPFQISPSEVYHSNYFLYQIWLKIHLY